MIGIRISGIILVMTLAMKQVSSYTETCIGEFCFAQPDSNELRNFDGAKSWCTNINSALAVVNNSDTQLALIQFLKSSNTSAMTFINMKLYQRDLTWFLVNGVRYKGDVGNQNLNIYKLYCYLQPYGNNFRVEASHPSEMNRYICEFQDTRCLNNSSNNILYNGRCYVKYEPDTLTWFQAREICVNNGGDLATFQSDPLNTAIPLLNTSWLNPLFAYWVGIRWNDWRWITPDGGNEAIYTSWSTEKPNNINYACVCVDPNGNPAWSWTDCNCEDQRQFVCLKIVPTTTTSTTTREPTISTTSEVIDGNPKSTANALILGLVLGIILPLIIVIIVLIIIIVHLRRQARDKPRSSESASAVPNTTSVQQDRSATELNTTAADTNYQHLQKASTPRITTQLYESLSQPEIRDYESVPEMT